MTEIVFPNDTNGLGAMMGGRMLHLMDKAGAISAQRHTNRVCVTTSVDSVEFRSPLRLGEVVVIESRVNRVFRTSMEVELEAWAENPLTRTRPPLQSGLLHLRGDRRRRQARASTSHYAGIRPREDAVRAGGRTPRNTAAHVRTPGHFR